MKRAPFCTHLETRTSVRRGHFHRNSAVRSTRAAIALLALAACNSSDDTSVRSPANNATEQELQRSQFTGEQLFSQPFPGAGNQRSCATCHVPEDNFTLTPEHVAQVFETNPNDPLFSAIDADDPSAATLSFEHLKKGLIRVGLTLPDNMDVIDDTGNVTTPSDRTIFVWRGVPSIANAAMTGPFQLDGRVLTLEERRKVPSPDTVRAARGPGASSSASPPSSVACSRRPTLEPWQSNWSRASPPMTLPT